MRRARRLAAPRFAILLLGIAGCAAPRQRTGSNTAYAGAAGALAATSGQGAAKVPWRKGDLPRAMVTPSLLVPQLGRAKLSPLASDDNVQHLVLAGLRISRTSAGEVSRSSDRFPSGAVHATRLPPHLGGGFLFYQTDSQGTRLWRAANWTAPLTPLIRLVTTTAEVISGFDRVYLRSQHGQLTAIDPATGRLRDKGHLPVGGAYGPMAFADGWRALVDVDLRGTMATFDGGASWFRVPLDQAPYAAGVTAGDPVVYTAGHSYRLKASGHFMASAPPSPTTAVDEAAAPPVHHPLGSNALRTAIEHGYPTQDGHVVVAYAGSLLRVSLPDAAVVGRNDDVALNELAQCSPLLVGDGFGFVCGVKGQSTTIYAYRPPLDLAQVVRFNTPRFVSSSGNGALVVRGPCSDEEHGTDTSADHTPTLRYCIVKVDGSLGEIVVAGAIGAERVVALRDGRSVVLVPPRLKRAGRITVIAGPNTETHQLKYPKYPKYQERTVTWARRGLWLRGFQQRGDDSIGGWIEAGGPGMGVQVSLDGKVTLGAALDDGRAMLVSGKLALAVNDTDGALESIDGGMSWRRIDIPQLPSALAYDRRGCSAVGCSLAGWARVGWGKNAIADDLATVATPKIETRSVHMPAATTLVCQPTGPALPVPATMSAGAQAPYNDWSSFISLPAPTLDKGTIGISKSTPRHHLIRAKVYVWGPTSAPWTRAGWWTIRVADRFAPSGVVSSARTRAPWQDVKEASAAIGTRYRGTYWSWYAALDPAGDAALVTLCRGPLCKPFSVVAGQPIVPMYNTHVVDLPKPMQHGVARLGERWFLLGHPPRQTDKVQLYRSSLGKLEAVRALRRFPAHGPQRRGVYVAAPRLVRTVHSNELGLLVRVPPNLMLGERVATMLVLPLDTTTGAVGEPIQLGIEHLTAPVRQCTAQDRGWRANITTTLAPVLDIEGLQGHIDNVELRMRLTPYSRCVEAIAAVGHHLRQLTSEGRPAHNSDAPTAAVAIPMMVRGESGAERWRLLCRPREEVVRGPARKPAVR